MTKEKRLDFRSEQGFTLMELIVVIGVIGILIAILLPQFNGYTDKANAVSAKSNAKTALTAVSAYRTEVDSSNIAWETDKAKDAMNKALGGVVTGTVVASPEGIIVDILNGANGEATVESKKGTLTFTTRIDIATGRLGRTSCKGDDTRCNNLKEAKAVEDVVTTTQP